MRTDPPSRILIADDQADVIETLLQRNPPPADWREDMERGLQVIASRTESLSRFTGASARLALPS